MCVYLCKPKTKWSEFLKKIGYVFGGMFESVSDVIDTFKIPEDKKDKIVHMERSYGSYSRQFDVSGIETNAIKAKYENGVLKLTLPKKQQALQEGKRLEIE